MLLSHVKHVADLEAHELLSRVRTLVAQDRAHTLELILHLGEVMRRGLFRDAGYSSMVRYCTGELRMSEWLAFKRLNAARLGRQYPEILRALADGRVHLDAVQLLSRYFRAGNVRELLGAATHRTSREVQQLIAERFPKPDPPTLVVAIPVAPFVEPAASGPALGFGDDPAGEVSALSCGLAARPVPVTNACASAPAPQPDPRTMDVRVPVPERARLQPTAPGRYVLQVTLSKETHDLLQRAQALLAHVEECREVEVVLNRALSELVSRLEARKFGAVARPREHRSPEGRPSANPRHIPAAVRREVAERDGKRCTHVNAKGERCTETAMLEFDHVLPVARGGESTASNLRLRCRAHNQLAAEQCYGAAFMDAKRGSRAAVHERVREHGPRYATRTDSRFEARDPRGAWAHGRRWPTARCQPIVNSWIGRYCAREPASAWRAACAFRVLQSHALRGPGGALPLRECAP